MPTHLQNTTQLINSVTSLEQNTIKQFKYPFSLDVVNLYTSIPPQKATEIVVQMIEQNSVCLYGLSPNDIADLLKVVLTNNYFIFNNVIFQQTHGLAMGNSVSAILAILYMGHVEKNALNVIDNHVGLYVRYVDDVFCLTESATEANKIHSTFNNIDPHVKFEIEHADDTNTLKLLDVALNIKSEGEVHFDFYTKAAKKPLFVNFKSALPTHSKMSYINNERHRIVNRCSDADRAKKHLASFDDVLRLNDYPPHLIKKSTLNKRKRRIESTEPASYFNIPFVNDIVNRKIRNSFKKEGLNVRLSHRSYSLRSALRNKRSYASRSCNKKDCPLGNNLCFRKNVVYKITCNKCNKSYIGSTVRDLHTRISEHFSISNSSVFQHVNSCKIKTSNMTVSIVDQESRNGNLRIREAYYIQKLKPQINSKEESCVDLILF